MNTAYQLEVHYCCSYYYSIICLLSVKLIIRRSTPFRLFVPTIVASIILSHLLFAFVVSVEAIPVVIVVVSNSILTISQPFLAVLQ